MEIFFKFVRNVLQVHGINYKEVLGLDQEKIIEGIKDGDYNILKDIYKNNFDCVRNYVLKNQGNEEDAKDIFQEAMVIVYNKANNGKFTANLYYCPKYRYYVVCPAEVPYPNTPIS